MVSQNEIVLFRNDALSPQRFWKFHQTIRLHEKIQYIAVAYYCVRLWLSLTSHIFINLPVHYNISHQGYEKNMSFLVIPQSEGWKCLNKVEPGILEDTKSDMSRKWRFFGVFFTGSIGLHRLWGSWSEKNAQPYFHGSWLLCNLCF